jgi:hypothetical protein
MTDISLGQFARPTRRGRTAIIGTISLDRFPAPRVNGRYSIDLGELRRQFDDTRVGRVATTGRECASCFVDFLLGRGARHSR